MIIKELKGDQFTPILILQKLTGTKKFLLESSHKYSDSGRYSFIGANPALELISYADKNMILDESGRLEEIMGNPLEIVNFLMPQPTEENNDPIPFTSGAVGYIGYDIIRQFEEIGEEFPNELNMPDAHLMFYEVIIVFDHLEDKVFVCGTRLLNETTKEKLEQKLLHIIEELKRPDSYQEEEPFQFFGFESTTTKGDFLQKVKTAKEHIKAGDAFQVVLSRRLKSTYKGTPLALYRKHRADNPTPYMFYIEFDDYTILGSSPESLIKSRVGKVNVNPIAGTKKRGSSQEEDEIIEKELLHDEKELAEHRMLVDLGRNDLGKVCEFSTVQVDRYMMVERFRHVMHLVSEISGRLKKGKTGLDALAACLPAGTVSGAPKIRAMEIINQLERSKRGVYAGAIGYISVNGNMDFALAIRTVILKDHFAYIQAGAGVVHDSSPESEYEETINKLKSFLEGVL